MSVLIKGRNLPNCCYYCPISDYSEDYDEWYCSLVNSNVTEFDTRRHPDCPLVDVPTPHGRLIDADEIGEEFRAYGFDGKYYGCTIGDLIDEQDTVIEAESEEA